MRIKINNFFSNKEIAKNSETKVKETQGIQNEKDVNAFKEIPEVEELHSQNNSSNRGVKRVRNGVETTNKRGNSNRQGNVSLNYTDKGKMNLKTGLENLFKNKNKLTRGYYLLLVAMVCLSTASVTLASKAYNIFSKEDYTTYASKEEDKNLGEAVTSSTNIDTNEQNSTESSTETNNKDTTDVTTNKAKASEETKARGC